MMVYTLIGITFYSCVGSREFVIESDYSYDGNFKRYKTFDFIQNVSQDTSFDHSKIERTMLSKLNAQGYSQSVKKPDLMISYKIMHRTFYLHGFQQPNFEQWVGGDLFMPEQQEIQSTQVDTYSRDNRTTDEDYTDPLDEEYKKARYLMNEGTLFVTFYDRKRKKTVWQGYASGVFSENGQKSDRSINIAASKIFNEFRLIRDGFLLKK